jgi:NADH dehydrogenase/NADH:ubiquinone oxidoreductase subunit G
MATVTIDDVKVQVEEGQTILDAAHKADIWIPTMCYNPSLTPVGNCRLCMVELDRGGWTKLVTACNYPVRGDITVRVNSKKALSVRKGIMKLLLARSPESKELKELALRMGVKGTPYPKVTESQRNCILCGMCITVCEEVIGRSAISFAGRGVDRAVAAPFRQASEDCIACGACAAICPVGTIQVRIHTDTGEAEVSPFKTRVKLLYCEECGAQMVPELVNRDMLDRVRFDFKEYRERLKLCPQCRRKHTAEALSLIPGKKQV